MSEREGRRLEVMLEHGETHVTDDDCSFCDAARRHGMTSREYADAIVRGDFK